MLNNNLKYLDNESLVERLSKMSLEKSCTGITFTMTKNNEYVLLKNDVPIDDVNDPVGAINTVIDKNLKYELQKNDIIVNFGIGIGYLLDISYERFPSKIYIYEPDTDLLHFVLSNIDISEHLASGRVFIFDKMDELLNDLSTRFITMDKVEILYIPNYAIIKQNELINLSTKVYETCKSKIVDVNTIKRYSNVWTMNTLKNLKNLRKDNCYKASDLYDKYQGKSVIIAGAGPSLADNIDLIKANRNKFVIISVNRALRYLIENGVTPDYVTALDAKFLHHSFDGIEASLSNISCLQDLRSDKILLNLPFKDYFLSFSKNDMIAETLVKSGNALVLENTGGSSATLALIMAINMGFSNIIFAGIDLAFKDDLIYANGAIPTIQEGQRAVINKIQKNIVEVKSVKGAKVKTTEDYQTFIYHFENIIKAYNKSNVYNITTFGAKIEGVMNIPLQELLTNLSDNSIVELKCTPLNLQLTPFKVSENAIMDRLVFLLSTNVINYETIKIVSTSAILYQFLQADLLFIVQHHFEQTDCDKFLIKLKDSIQKLKSLLNE